MFTPKTERIEELSKIFPTQISELEDIFNSNSAIYIDWSNIIHLQDKLGIHLHTKRIKQFLDSFSNIKSINFYSGTDESEPKSVDGINDIKIQGYNVTTKSVKNIKISIDTTSVSDDSTSLLKGFIKKGLLKKLDIETVAFINSKLKELNKKGILYIEEQKCNFDVEMGRDMLRDFENGKIDNFIIWSGDSDFADPIIQLKKDGKKVCVFALSGSVPSEINDADIRIFDLRKIKEFICWPKEIPQSVLDKISKINK